MLTRLISKCKIHQRPLIVPPSNENSISVFIDGREISVPPTATIMQACAVGGVDIPRFCYHERLAIAGNCRMCLVQVNGAAKLTASCAAPVMKSMKIETNNNIVKKVRAGVMEFLLANHPLDCPICDQGGECDLQDQAMAFGSDKSRFFLDKRAVEDKNLGPLIKTSMNRCIHCTRCVRFANELAGVQELGTTGRGNDMQIGTFIQQIIDSEISGNVIDLCPVGALTSKPYSFMARPWELVKTNSIDVMDAIGSAIRIDTRGSQVLRIIPRLNEQVNEEWLSDKGRFSCDGLAIQRLVDPLFRIGKSIKIKNENDKEPSNHNDNNFNLDSSSNFKINNDNGNPISSKYEVIDWETALKIFSSKLMQTNPMEIEAYVGQFTDMETIKALKDLLDRLKCKNLYFDDGTIPDSPFYPNLLPQLYQLNTTLEGLEVADSILLVGTDPRLEAPLLNLRIRKNWLKSNVKIGLIGPRPKKALNYDYEYLGSSFRDLEKNLDFPKIFINSQRPVIIASQLAIDHRPTRSVLAQIALNTPNLLASDWNGWNVLSLDASRMGAIKLGWGSSCIPSPSNSLSTSTSSFTFSSQNLYPSAKLSILLGADRDLSHRLSSKINSPHSPFIVYIGHHGEIGAEQADLILPSATYTEKQALFMNMEGRLQETMGAIPPPGNAKVDWEIIRAVAELSDIQLPFNNLDELRELIISQLLTADSLDSSSLNSLDSSQSQPSSLSISSKLSLNTGENGENCHFALVEGLKKWAEYSKFSSFNTFNSSNHIPSSTFHPSTSSSLSGQEGKNDNFIYKRAIENYWMTNVIGRNSPTMAKCSMAFNNKLEN